MLGRAERSSANPSRIQPEPSIVWIPHGGIPRFRCGWTSTGLVSCFSEKRSPISSLHQQSPLANRRIQAGLPHWSSYRVSARRSFVIPVVTAVLSTEVPVVGLSVLDPRDCDPVDTDSWVTADITLWCRLGIYFTYIRCRIVHT